MKFLLAATAFLVLGCGNSGNSSGATGRTDEAGIPAAIIGAWEIESMSMGGRSMKVDRPDPRNPYRKLNTSDWTQLKIDEQNLALISTDFVFYSAPELPYKVVGKKIVTIDEKNFSLTDFIVHEYSENRLVLEFSYDGESSSGARWIFKRINESGLATKTAKAVNFSQKVMVSVEQAAKPIVGMNKEVVGEVDYSKKGFHDSIGCSLNKDKSLQFSYYVLEVKDRSVGTGGDLDRVSLEFKGLNPDLNGPQKTMTSNSEIDISVSSNKKSYYNSISGCEHTVVRNGASLSIETICNSSKDNTKVQFSGVCLLKHNVW